MKIRQFIRESILTQVSLIEEAKDSLIRRIPGLTADQKDQLIEKYRKNPYLENLKDEVGDPVIDWNRLNKLTWEDFEPVINHVSKTQEKQDIKVSGAEVLFENDKVLVVKPMTEKASICYGKGTKWCTAAMSNNMFKSYFVHDEITLIYVIDKKITDSNNMYNKMAIAISENGRNEIYDAADDRMSEELFLTKTGRMGVPDDVFKWHDDREAREKELIPIEKICVKNDLDGFLQLIKDGGYPKDIEEEVHFIDIMLDENKAHWLKHIRDLITRNVYVKEPYIARKIVSSDYETFAYLVEKYDYLAYTDTTISVTVSGYYIYPPYNMKEQSRSVFNRLINLGGQSKIGTKELTAIIQKAAEIRDVDTLTTIAKNTKSDEIRIKMITEAFNSSNTIDILKNFSPELIKETIMNDLLNLGRTGSPNSEGRMTYNLFHRSNPEELVRWLHKKVPDLNLFFIWVYFVAGFNGWYDADMFKLIVELSDGDMTMPITSIRNSFMRDRLSFWGEKFSEEDLITIASEGMKANNQETVDMVALVAQSKIYHKPGVVEWLIESGYTGFNDDDNEFGGSPL